MATKLLLIPCSGEETTKLAKDIFHILHHDFGLEERVELLDSKHRSDVPKGMIKDYRHPLVADHFADMEAEIDIGRNQLYDEVRGKHVVLVEHMLTPVRQVAAGQSVSVNDHLMTVRGFLNVLGNTDVSRVSLAAPYLGYVRSHSIEKYQRMGFFQFDSLKVMMRDLAKDGLKTIITIDPHSDKARQVAEEMGMFFHGVNPFQSGRAINPYKLGLIDEKQAKQALQRLRPFQEKFAVLREKHKGHLYGVSVDDGTEHRVENVIERAFPELPPEEVYRLIAYLGKDRDSYGDPSQSYFKPFSQIRKGNIDPQGVFILLDDMYASGGTAGGVAQQLKEKGAYRVEVWTTHPVTMPVQYDKANVRSTIDQVVCLDTVPQPPELQVDIIEASAYLLAAEVYKAHERLVGTK